MPRVRWNPPLEIILSTIFIAFFSIVQLTIADCWYGGDKHDEGVEVATAEPCLNCTCSKGALLCYLRVCPKLPNPPPLGCILLHRYRACCPQLVCTDLFTNNNGLEGRSEPDSDTEITYDNNKIIENACIANGTIYGSGSAMDSSSFCEYCYCLKGKQVCVKPKCLLPIKGCIPKYDQTSCCPVHYNCTSHMTTTSTTTTTTVKPKHGGCLVDNKFFNEGHKILGAGHSVCDNCYCLRGIIRCEPLSCAPPLLGCIPVIKPGECCAASYNCSGTIEIQPKPNYGKYPIVSKEYAKLRKEVEVNQSTKKDTVYVIADSKPTTKTQRNYGTTRHFSGVSFNPSTIKPFYFKDLNLNNKNKQIIKNNNNNNNINHSGSIYYATTNYEFQNRNYKRPTTIKPPIISTSKFRSNDYLEVNDETLLSIVDSLLNDRLNRRVDNIVDETTTTIPTTIVPTTTTTTTTTTATTKIDETETLSTSQTTDNDLSTEEITLTPPITIKTIVLNSTDCIDTTIEKRHDFIDVTTILPVDANEINKLADNYQSTYEDFNIETTTNNIEGKLNPIIPEIETILNSSKVKGVDYDYDYNEPSLPPSLPNLKIIPFVAADALDSKKEVDNLLPYQQKQQKEKHRQQQQQQQQQQQIEKRITHNYPYGNLFVPPKETEGGFIPKDPPDMILENFYENTLVNIPSITNKPMKINCFSNDQEINHGQSVPSESPCMTCTCFYGNIVCQKILCPMVNCMNFSNLNELNLCCSLPICDVSKESKMENEIGKFTLDPFKNVIKTEPAPDLQSLIVNGKPELKKTTTPAIITTTMTTITTTTSSTSKNNNTDDNFSLDKILHILFSKNNDQENSTPTTTITQRPTITTVTTKTTTTTTINKNTSKENLKTNETIQEENKVDSPLAGVGLLKLAGCNIYGRMYRVGRIISELSNACLECKCTEIGVHCRELKC